MLIASIKSLHPIPNEVDAVELRLDLNPKLRSFKTNKPLIIKSNDPNDANLGAYYDCDWTKTAPDHPRIICSCHMDHTPDDLLSIFEKLEKAHPQAVIYKLAAMAHSTLDALRMLIATRILTARGKNVIGVCIGELGQITRIASPSTYIHLGEPTAPGQLSLKELSIYNRNKAFWYGLIGDPISQSFSHLTHNKRCLFLKMRVQKGELEQFFSLAEQLPFAGLAVTIPHKEFFGIPINTLVRASSGWDKYNTDGPGALNVLGPVENKHLAILGAGGASKAIAFEAQKRGAHITVYNRTPKVILGKQTKPLTDIAPYDILINATSCGMLSTDCPIAPDQIRSKTTIMETICTPEETTLLKYAKEKGCSRIFGKEMFYSQAALQYELWQM